MKQIEYVQCFCMSNSDVCMKLTTDTNNNITHTLIRAANLAMLKTYHKFVNIIITSGNLKLQAFDMRTKRIYCIRTLPLIVMDV